MMSLLAFGMPAAPEWIFIGILALLLFGPKKLPDLARGVGKALAELQKAKEDFHREITGVPPMPTIKAPEGVERVQGVPVVEEVPEPKPSVAEGQPSESVPVLGTVPPASHEEKKS